MVVRQDIAVSRQDEAGAGGSGRRLIAPVVRGDGGRDADRGIDVGGVDLSSRHFLARVDL